MACRICGHPELAELEQELVAGGRYFRIDMWYGYDPHSLRWHVLHHMPRKLQEKRLPVQMNRVRAQTNKTRQRCERVQEDAEARKYDLTRDLMRRLAEPLMEDENDENDETVEN